MVTTYIQSWKAILFWSVIWSPYRLALNSSIVQAQGISSNFLVVSTSLFGRCILGGQQTICKEGNHWRILTSALDLHAPSHKCKLPPRSSSDQVNPSITVYNLTETANRPVCPSHRYRLSTPTTLAIRIPDISRPYLSSIKSPPRVSKAHDRYQTNRTRDRKSMYRYQTKSL